MYSPSLEKLIKQHLSQHPRMKEVGPNQEGKDYFIGNICGQYSQFMKALKKVAFVPTKDRVFTVGNVIDYGEDSQKILELLSEPWFYSIAGIHELLMECALHSDQHLHWYNQGGRWAFDKNMMLKPELTKFAKTLRHLPLAIQLSHKKHGVFGMLSSTSGDIDVWDDFTQVTTEQLLSTLTDNGLAQRKRKSVKGVDCLLVGNQPSSRVWSKGNLVCINLGAKYLPERGELKLFKAKRLLKEMEARNGCSPIHERHATLT